ncbi:hypothetical protein ACFL27_04825, partial [candidate division CSSED10-310 bacterium]
CQSSEILTITGVRDYVMKGVATGVIKKAGETEILINLGSVKATKVDFKVTLLKIATLIK